MRTPELEQTIAGDDSLPGRGDGRHLALGQGDVVGRYVVLRKLGSGGMGVVYVAYDPELDRRVAIKLLLAEPDARTESDAGRSRLLREAQALAKLGHPNVVTVHDVGTLGERVYVAMEFVEGRTLTEWLASTPTWREVVAVFAKAGAGLAAAHDKQLLHRDFKPDNVMVGDDGRVLVMDFGLARPTTGAAAPRSRPSLDEDALIRESTAGKDLLNTDLTVAGALVGTPAYMAPECIAGLANDERSDQYSFCVALWEGIHGERPFAGGTLVELASNVLEGQLRPARRSVPRWLQRLVVRGLSADPDQRFGSMRELLAELTHGQARARRWRGAGLGLGLAVAVGAVFGVRQLERRQVMSECRAAGDDIAEVWGERQRGEVRRALVATGASYAETTADKAIPWLDQQADEWRAARTEVCTRARSEGSWTEDTLARSLWCLEERRGELAALVEQFLDADELGLQKAVSAAAGLRAIDPCLDAAVLDRRSPPPSENVEAIRGVRVASQRADALLHAGRFDDAVETAQAALVEAEALEWPPLAAAVRTQLGSALAGSSDYAGAAEALDQAYFEAAHARDAELSFEAAVLLVDVLRHLAKLDEAAHWAELARVELARAGDDPLRGALLDATLASVMAARADYQQDRELAERALATRERILGPRHPSVASSLNNLALAHKRAGDYAGAQALLERAIELHRAGLGEAHPVLASSINNLGNTLQAAGEYDLALDHHRLALDIRKQTLGPEHALVADSLNNIAIIYDLRGDYDQAIALYTEALDLREKSFGPDHPRVASSLQNLAIVYRLTGDYEQARALAQRSLTILEVSLGPEHPRLAASLGTLAAIHRAEGDYEQALAVQLRTLAIREAALGPDHPLVANTLSNVALVHRSSGDLAQARAYYERALAVAEAAVGPEHPSAAAPLLGLAQLALTDGRFADALPLAERALAIRTKEGTNDAEMGEVSFAVAEALWGVGSDPERAIELAERSLELVDDEDFRARVTARLAELSPPAG